MKAGIDFDVTSPALRICNEIATERFRQVREEGWTPDHDDKYTFGELVAAGVTYALEATPPLHRPKGIWHTKLWPWHMDWWKPKDRRRDLIRAAALLVAEIERLDRAGEA